MQLAQIKAIQCARVFRRPDGWYFDLDRGRIADGPYQARQEAFADAKLAFQRLQSAH